MINAKIDICNRSLNTLVGRKGKGGGRRSSRPLGEENLDTCHLNLVLDEEKDFFQVQRKHELLQVW